MEHVCGWEDKGLRIGEGGLGLGVVVRQVNTTARDLMPPTFKNEKFTQREAAWFLTVYRAY